MNFSATTNASTYSVTTSNETINNATVPKSVTEVVPTPEISPWTPYIIVEEIGLIVCSIIVLIGAIGNFLTFFFIVRSKSNRTPTYIVISSMALADCLSLCSFYIYDLGILFVKTTKVSYGFYCYHVGLFGEIFRHASMTQIVLLSALRYAVTVHPLKCKHHVTAKRTVFVCVGLWGISIVFGCIILTAQLIINGQTTIDELGHSINEYYFSMTNLVYYLSVPTILICVFHVLKLRGLKTSLTGRDEHIARMTKMTGIVIMLYVITVTPFYAFNLAASLFTDSFWLYFTLHVTNVGYYMNYSINPLIYFVFSPVCRGVGKKKEKNVIFRRQQAVPNPYKDNGSTTHSDAQPTDDTLFGDNRNDARNGQVPYPQLSPDLLKREKIK